MSAAQKISYVRRFLGSKQSLAGFARLHGLNVSTLHSWVQRYAPPSYHTTSNKKESTAPIAFLELGDIHSDIAVAAESKLRFSLRYEGIAADFFEGYIMDDVALVIALLRGDKE